MSTGEARRFSHSGFRNHPVGALGEVCDPPSSPKRGDRSPSVASGSSGGRPGPHARIHGSFSWSARCPALQERLPWRCLMRVAIRMTVTCPGAWVHAVVDGPSRRAPVPDTNRYPPGRAPYPTRHPSRTARATWVGRPSGSLRRTRIDRPAGRAREFDQRRDRQVVTLS